MKELNFEGPHVPADTRKEQALEMMEGGGKIGGARFIADIAE